VDYRECLEHAYDILGGINVLKKFFGFSRVIIAVEDNKPAAIKKLSAIADEDLDAGNIVRVMTLRSRYPQGAEKMMVLSATGRRVPPLTWQGKPAPPRPTSPDARTAAIRSSLELTTGGVSPSTTRISPSDLMVTPLVISPFASLTGVILNIVMPRIRAVFDKHFRGKDAHP